MATVSSDQVILSSDSDAETGMYCEHCEKESRKSISAAAYCEECMELMCSVCIPYHKKFNPNHTLKENNDMPQHFCADKCDVHTKEIVKFYCSKCNKVACVKCKETFHGELCDLQFIPNIVRDQDLREVKKELENEINTFSNNLDDTLIKITNNIKESSGIGSKAINDIEICKEEIKNDFIAQRQKILEDFESQRKDLLKRLDKRKAEKLQLFDTKQAIIMKNIDNAEETLCKHVCEFMENDHTKLSDLKQKTESMKNKVETMKQDEDKIQGNAVRAFVAMYNSRTSQKEYIEILKENDVQRYVFLPKKEKVNIEANCEENIFGHLVLPKSSKDKRYIYSTDIIIVKEEKIIRASRLVDLCQLSDFRLVVADDFDMSLKLIDTREKKVLYRIQLSSPPYALAKTSDDQVAVTLPDEKKIKVFSVACNNEMILSNDIVGLGLLYKGMAYNPPTLYFSADDKVFWLDINCIDTGSLKITQFGQTLYSQPNRMVFNPRLKSIYLVEGQVIVNIDFAGRILNKSKSLMNDIQGIALGNSDTVYVSTHGSFNGKIFQLSSDLSIVHELLKGVFLAPFGLHVCDKEKKLYCGSFSKINVYEIQ